MKSKEKSKNEFKENGYYYKFYPNLKNECDSIVRIKFVEFLYQERKLKHFLLLDLSTTLFEYPIVLVFNSNHDIVATYFATKEFNHVLQNNVYNNYSYVKHSERFRGLRNTYSCLLNNILFYETYEYLQSIDNPDNIVGMKMQVSEKIYQKFFKKKPELDNDYIKASLIDVETRTYMMYYSDIN